GDLRDAVVRLGGVAVENLLGHRSRIGVDSVRGRIAAEGHSVRGRIVAGATPYASVPASGAALASDAVPAPAAASDPGSGSGNGEDIWLVCEPNAPSEKSLTPPRRSQSSPSPVCQPVSIAHGTS